MLESNEEKVLKLCMRDGISLKSALFFGIH